VTGDSIQLPFLKWPGGKRWAISRLAPLVEQHLTGRYFEPFLGGGALFFAVQPSSALLSDINAELINAYRLAQARPAALIAHLKTLPVSRAHYDLLRAQSGGRDLARATRFLYLNRTCFGGIYRVNCQGQFNVPFGGGERTPEPLWTRNLLLNASRALKCAQLQACDFEASIEKARKGDFVYCDPTYTVAHDNNGFVRYNEKNFSWLDQERLASAITRAHRRGASVLLSNAHHCDIKRLFVAPKRWVLRRASSVCRDIAYRANVAEYLFFWPGRNI
jgi:DNA adenine methylase